MRVKITKGINRELYVKINYSNTHMKHMKKINNCKYSETYGWQVPYNIINLQKIGEIFAGEELSIDQKINERAIEIIKVSVSNTSVIKDAEKLLKLKGYSNKTIKTYIGHMRRFVEHMNKNIQEVKNSDIEDYILYLLDREKVSHSYGNQAISSIKFLMEDVCDTFKFTMKIPRPKRESKLPKVLSKEEVIQILDSNVNLKHKILLFLVYSAGLRVSEVVRLKVNDIDYERNLIFINKSKGFKDRYTTLSVIAKEELTKYINKYNPDSWLFPGQDENFHLSERTAQRIFENACRKANINKRVSIHCLRHYVELNIMVSIAFFLCIAL